MEGELVNVFGAFGAGFMVLWVLWLILMIGLYVYTSFAFMRIGEKAKDSTPGLAWIPYVGPVLIAYRSSGMHWWPWLLLIGILIPILGFFALIAFTVFMFIWYWKLFEAIGKPGWWPLMALIPGVGILIFLILVGIAAWGKD
ncbi:MAG: hypothetical protein ACOCQG_05585 [Candidatus Nanoarchaeia archaeon]